MASSTVALSIVGFLLLFCSVVHGTILGSNHFQTSPRKDLTQAQVLDCAASELERLEGPAVSLDDLPSNFDELSDGLHFYKVDGAVCADGSPFYFGVVKQSRSKLHMYYSGGGACVDYSTCCDSKPYFQSSPVSVDMLALAGCVELDNPLVSDILNGMFAANNPQNPLNDYSAFLGLYCTGDIWIGAEDHVYSDGENSCTVSHNGNVNAQIMNEYARNLFPVESLTHLVFSGDSAGGYGSLFQLAQQLLLYQKETGLEDPVTAQLPVTWIGDSSAGVAVFSPSWGLKAFPEIYESGLLSPDSVSDEVLLAGPPDSRFFSSSHFLWRDVIRNSSHVFPCLSMGEFSTNLDRSQKFFAASTIAICDDCCPAQPRSCGSDFFEDFLNSSVEYTLETASPQYSYLLATGDFHTLIRDEKFFTELGNLFKAPNTFVQAKNVTPVEWVTDLMIRAETCVASQASRTPPPPESSAACFPASSTVTTINGESVMMRNLQVGEWVLSSISRNGEAEYSQIQMFGHADPHRMYRFVEIYYSCETETCQIPLTLSESHSVITTSVNGHRVLRRAIDLKPNDIIYVSLNSTFTQSRSIVHIQKHKMHQGLYHPHTSSGLLIVNGVQVSCYNSWTWLSPTTQHFILLPYRILTPLYLLPTLNFLKYLQNCIVSHKIHYAISNIFHWMRHHINSALLSNYF
mmetsp:Transcript_10705/g.19341  ORF Transcript_10705/g.19341 Transcript_10705/m.19341 type:complete len:687 (+) Transcript_10705:98-2158(+)